MECSVGTTKGTGVRGNRRYHPFPSLNFCFRNGWDYKCIESDHITCDLVGDIYLPEEAAESRAVVDLPPEPHREVELRATRGIVHPPNSILFLKWVGV